MLLKNSEDKGIVAENTVGVNPTIVYRKLICTHFASKKVDLQMWWIFPVACFIPFLLRRAVTSMGPVFRLNMFALKEFLVWSIRQELSLSIPYVMNLFGMAEREMDF